MAWIDEEVSAQFARWEEPGRGWRVWPTPVEPEPPFVPFGGYTADASQFEDDGGAPSALTSVLTKLGLLIKVPAPEPPSETAPEPEPRVFERTDQVELQLSFPTRFAGKMQEIAALFTQVGLCREPITFEILATSERITAQFAAHPEDAHSLRRQINAHFADVVVSDAQMALASLWETADESETLVVEFGLAREFAMPLAQTRSDPYVGIMAALSELRLGEVGLYQVIFQPVENPWAEHLLRAVSHADGKPLFQNEPELTKLAQEKTSSPLFAVVLRIAIRADDFERTLEIARDMAGSLRVFGRLDGNELIPLHNGEYPYEAHVEDVVLRQSRRSGMVLNAEELTGFVHLPTAEVRAPKLQRDSVKTKAAPKANTTHQSGLLLGQNTHAGRTSDVQLSPAERSRHIHLIGASGTGKSTLLFNLIQQDIESGQGLAVLDPHGDLIDKILSCIPEHRIDDVIVFDPSDENYSIGFNVLSAHSDLEKNLLASDLVSVFQRLSTSWGDQMGSVLQNAILAFLESSRGGTLADLRRFLLETEFRNEFLQTVNDPEIVYYWRKAFPQLSGNKSIGPVLTRLETFLAPKPIRYMVSQPVNRLDFREIMDSGKVLLAKLSQGQVGKENAFLLGSLLMAKFQQTAMSRQSQNIASRRPFWLYLDEFQNFITPSMAEILTGARKYNVGLVLAHQELRQLERDREVASAVLSNCYTRIAFRVGDDDARKLAEGFASFEARDLQNLNIGQAICRVERSDNDFNLSVPLLGETDPDAASERHAKVTTVSREKYGTPRAKVEAGLRKPVEKPAAFETAAAASSEVTSLPMAPLPVAMPPVELASSAVTEARPEAIPRPSAARGLGRGGQQHKSLQERIQAKARALGFYAEVEGRLAKTSNQAADLVIKKGNWSIAVEIAVTNTVDHEFGNVKKCLAAGFGSVAVVSHRPEHLNAIRNSVQAGLGSTEASKVAFHTPDDFLLEIERLAQVHDEPLSPSKSENVVGGFKVRRKFAELTAEERKEKEDIAIASMAEAMKSKARTSPSVNTVKRPRGSKH